MASLFRILLPALALGSGLIVGSAALRAQSGSDPFGQNNRGVSEPMRQQRSLEFPNVIFYPPNPPPVNRPFLRSPLQGPGPAAPEDLAQFVAEPFYPQLSTRLVNKSYPDKLRKRVEDYRRARVALRDELRAEFDKLRDAEAPARRQALETLARSQRPKLQELEKTAEQLRGDLIASGADWNDLREWRLRDRDRRGYSPFEIAVVMRGYAFYHAGLLPAQRRLLREIAIEMQLAAESTEKAAANQPYLFFQPELARVNVPVDIPAELAAKIAAFETKKSLLKKELYDAVQAHDGGFNIFTSTLRALPEKQKQRISELDTLADDIRAQLATLNRSPHEIEPSPLPGYLATRMNALVRALTTLQREAAARGDVLVADAQKLPLRVAYRFDPDGLKFVVAPRTRAPLSTEAAARADELRTAFGALASDYGERLAVILNDRQALAVDIGQHLGTEDKAKIDALFMKAHRIALQYESQDLYREYRLAVFEAGLCPEQRRLLFDFAVEELGLPLPRGELQPTRRANSW